MTKQEIQADFQIRLHKAIEMYSKGGTLLEARNKYRVNMKDLCNLKAKLQIPSLSNIKFPINEDLFEKMEDKESWYFLGLLFADGNIYKDKIHNCTSISIKLKESDKAILEKFSEKIYQNKKDLYFDKSKNPNHSNNYCVSFTSNVVANRLINLGMIPKKSLVLKFPIIEDDEFFRYFLRGYSDGDGCIYVPINSGRPYASFLGTLDFCNGVQNRLFSILNIKGTIIKKVNVFKFNFQNRNHVLIYLNWLYKDFENDGRLGLERKYNKYLQIKEFYNQLDIKNNGSI